MSARPLRTVLNSASLVMIGVPRKLQNKTILDFNTYDSADYEKVRDTVSKYINDLDLCFKNNQGLCFFGANGLGKTLLASIIIKEAYRHRYSAYRLTFVEYLSVYTRVWDAKNSEERSEMEADLYKYKAAEFLALEEVGKEIDSSIAAPILEDLLRYREDKGFPIILCTNLQMDVLAKKYGASVSSLIKGNTTPIKIEGEDKRRQYYLKR